VLELKILFKPARQQKPVNTIVECGLRIDWPTPEDGGSPILEYNVEVQRKDGQFYRMTFCGQKPQQQTHCIVPMSKLQGDPINLQKGDDILVRASAFNKKGWSPVSPLSNAMGILSTPDAP